MESITSFVSDVFGVLLLVAIFALSVAAAVNLKVRRALISTVIIALGIKMIFFSSSPSSTTPNTAIAKPEATYAPLTTPSRTPISAPTREPESVTVTIENYRYKGDNQRITCYGPRGNVVCRPALPDE